ncbi:unnamed protein product [Coccothraustes coccothraustes]
MLAAARLAVPLFFHNSANTFQATRSENDTEFHRASEGSGRARPRQPAGAGSALRPPPVPPPQGASAESRVAEFRALTALGQASVHRRRFLPQVLPTPPSLPAGRGAAPAPRRDSGAQRRLPPGAPSRSPGQPPVPNMAAGERPESRRRWAPQGKFPSSSPAGPDPSQSPGRLEHGRTAPLTRPTRFDLQLFSWMRLMLLLLYGPANKTRFMVVGTLLALMDGFASGKVVIIRAISRLESVDPALQRPGHFVREFHFKLPNKEVRTSTQP